MRQHIPMSTKQKKDWRKFKKTLTNVVDDKDILFIAKMFSDVFMTKPFIPCKCEGKKIKAYIHMLDKVYELSVKK